MNPDQSFLNNPTYNYYGAKPESEIQSREIKKSSFPGIVKARQLYFETKSSASVEFPYWYTRKWKETEGEIPIVRRAEERRGTIEQMHEIARKKGGKCLSKVYRTKSF